MRIHSESSAYLLIILATINSVYYLVILLHLFSSLGHDLVRDLWKKNTRDGGVVVYYE